MGLVDKMVSQINQTFSLNDNVIMFATVDIGRGVATVTGKCAFTQKEYTTPEIPIDNLYAFFVRGLHAQHAMPTTPAEVREFLISRISPEGWAQTFPEGEED